MSHIDLKYRPISYFWAADKGIHLSSNIMGAERKAMYEHLIAEGKEDLIDDWIASPVLSIEDRALIGRSHPAFMGGEYLPQRVYKKLRLRASLLHQLRKT